MSGFSQVALGAHFYGIYTKIPFKLASFKNQGHKIVSSWTKIPRIIFFLNLDLKTLPLQT